MSPSPKKHIYIHDQHEHHEHHQHEHHDIHDLNKIDMNGSTLKAKKLGLSNEDHLKALEAHQKNSKSYTLKAIIKNAKKNARNLEDERQRKLLEKRKKNDKSILIIT